jgi:hypothetical protein
VEGFGISIAVQAESGQELTKIGLIWLFLKVRAVGLLRSGVMLRPAKTGHLKPSSINAISTHLVNQF